MTMEMLLFYLVITKRKYSKGAYLGNDHHPQIVLVFETKDWYNETSHTTYPRQYSKRLLQCRK